MINNDTLSISVDTVTYRTITRSPSRSEDLTVPHQSTRHRHSIHNVNLLQPAPPKRRSIKLNEVLWLSVQDPNQHLRVRNGPRLRTTVGLRERRRRVAIDSCDGWDSHPLLTRKRTRKRDACLLTDCIVKWWRKIRNSSLCLFTCSCSPYNVSL